jgi:hypothetical protein
MLPLIIGPWKIALPIFIIILIIIVLIVNSSIRRKKRNKALMDMYKNKEENK